MLNRELNKSFRRKSFRKEKTAKKLTLPNSAVGSVPYAGIL